MRSFLEQSSIPIVLGKNCPGTMTTPHHFGKLRAENSCQICSRTCMHLPGAGDISVSNQGDNFVDHEWILDFFSGFKSSREARSYPSKTSKTV